MFQSHQCSTTCRRQNFSLVFEDSPKSAISSMDGQELNGFNIRVNAAKEWLPLSLDEGVEEDETKGNKKVVIRSVWKDPFVDAFLMKKTNAALNRRSTILPEYGDSSVRIYNGKTHVRCKITDSSTLKLSKCSWNLRMI
ncbi:unnamed protein product [Arabis nemorensis]|uniref:RRM domain-containing protein n=1 Tax=Arabis nemorensis TaxID=586526 RepID=A0A565CRU6_9BRAS|nr:unnamed protein product [Arabis nemorensis]